MCRDATGVLHPSGNEKVIHWNGITMNGITYGMPGFCWIRRCEEKSGTLHRQASLVVRLLEFT